MRRFGALQFVVDLVAVGFTREFGPLITGLAVSGRSASAISAEIGTMVVTEEVDALRVMGLDPVEFTLAPKYLAALITLPCLTILSTLCGIFAGYLFLAFSIDMSLRVYFQAVAETILPRDIALSLVKSVVFATIIVHVGCLEGLRVRGGPEAVGLSATTAVVKSTFLVILADFGRHSDLLPDGMECRRMTSPSAPNTSDPIDLHTQCIDVVRLDGACWSGSTWMSTAAKSWSCSGGSGSGKTTLLKHVLGLTKPDTGSIRIDGVDITSCSPSELAAVRRRIGVAFQASALFNSLSPLRTTLPCRCRS